MSQDCKPGLLVLASTYPRWTGDPEPGFVHELARRLTGDFHVTVLCPHAHGAAVEETMDGVDVVRYRYAPEAWETLVNDGGIVTNLKRAKWKFLLVPGFVLAQLWCAWRLVRRRRIDAVHAHWLIPQGLIAAIMQSLPGRKVPFLVTSHGADLYALKGPWFDRLKVFVARRAAAVTVVSGAMRERLVALGVPSGKTSVQPMGVDLQGRFTPSPGVRRSESGILFVGRMVEKKGLSQLLEAMPAVLRERPDALLDIAGFGPEETALRRKVACMALNGRIRFLGAVRQAEIPALYRQAALFVAPFVEAKSGDQEGLGLVVVEAIGCGCPVLVGRVPAVADVLGPRYESLLVDPSDTAAFAGRILAALGDPDRMRGCAAGLRDDVMRRFHWDEVARGYAGALSKALKMRRGSDL